MKLKFEEWIEKASYSIDAKHLLNSGAVCYKAGTYSAALLMSYLGFLVIIKQRILTSDKPPIYPQGKWDKLISEIQNEDKWEASVIDALKEQEISASGVVSKDPVFTCNDSIRSQIVYWKDRRNDCAHHKDNEITNAHVETFWSFLQSNLQKITVPGGAKSLINKFTQFYDVSYTPLNQDVAPLVAEVKSSVHKANLAGFWTELFTVANNGVDYANEIKLIDEIRRISDAELDNSIINHLKTQPVLLSNYIGNRPNIIQHLGYTPAEIRNLWKAKIFSGPTPLKVYAHMLRTGLIPDAEKQEANDLLASKLAYTKNAGDHQTLLENGFGDHLYHHLFVKPDPQLYDYWKFLHEKGEVATEYIRSYPIKDEVVKILIPLFMSAYLPYSLQSGLKALFTRDAEKKKEFVDIATRLGLTVPGNILPDVTP